MLSDLGSTSFSSWFLRFLTLFLIQEPSNNGQTKKNAVFFCAQSRISTAIQQSNSFLQIMTFDFLPYTPKKIQFCPYS